MASVDGLGDRLRTAIHKAGLTQNVAREMLQTAGVPGASHANLYKVLAGKTSPSADFVVGASRELGVSAGWLLTGKGKMKESEPIRPEDVERYGLQDLPESIQHDVSNLAFTLFAATDRKGLNLEDTQRRIEALSRGIAAWLRIPPLSDKFHSPATDLEATAYCDLALRALRSLIPTSEDTPTPGGYDRVMVKLARVERKAAGRWKFTNKDPGRPDIPAVLKVALYGLEEGSEP